MYILAHHNLHIPRIRQHIPTARFAIKTAVYAFVKLQVLICLCLKGYARTVGRRKSVSGGPFAGMGKGCVMPARKVTLAAVLIPAIAPEDKLLPFDGVEAAVGGGVGCAGTLRMRAGSKVLAAADCGGKKSCLPSAESLKYLISVRSFQASALLLVPSDNQDLEGCAGAGADFGASGMPFF